MTFEFKLQIQQSNNQATPNKQRLVTETLAAKQQTQNRTPTLLPQNANQSIRPNQASSVSTQTSVNQNQLLVNQKNAKLRTKPPNVRPAVPNLKTDAGNQTKLMTGPQTMQQIPTSAGTKMVVTMSNNAAQMISQMIPKQQQQTTYLQQVNIALHTSIFRRLFAPLLLRPISHSKNSNRINKFK